MQAEAQMRENPPQPKPQIGGEIMTDIDEWGRLPIHYAARDGDTDIQSLIAAAGPDIRDNDGWTPLHFAAMFGHAETVRLLLDAGADIDATTNDGKPAIYLAAKSARGDAIGTIRLLRARGADPTAETIKSYFGLRSPLHYIREWGNRDAIQAEFADLL